MARNLNYQAAPPLAIAEGATTPNPGIAGVTVWSTTLLKPVYWTGTQWTAGSAGGGGSAPPVLVQLTVPLVAFNGYAEVVVLNGAVTLSSTIRASLYGRADAENDLEELADTDLRLVAVPETGQIRFVLTGNSPFVGTFSALYEVFNP